MAKENFMYHFRYTSMNNSFSICTPKTNVKDEPPYLSDTSPVQLTAAMSNL